MTWHGVLNRALDFYRNLDLLLDLNAMDDVFDRSLELDLDLQLEFNARLGAVLSDFDDLDRYSSLGFFARARALVSDFRSSARAVVGPVYWVRLFIRFYDVLRDLRCAVDTRSAVLGASRKSAAAPAMPGRAIRGMVGLTVRLLPVGQRPRYREEFGDELAELSCRQRCGYALRVLARVWQLRRALVKAVRTSDGEPVRRAER